MLEYKEANADSSDGSVRMFEPPSHSRTSKSPLVIPGEDDSSSEHCQQSGTEHVFVRCCFVFFSTCMFCVRSVSREPQRFGHVRECHTTIEFLSYIYLALCHIFEKGKQ